MRNIPDVTLIEVGGRNGTTTDFILAEQPHWEILILEPNPEFFWALSRRYDCEERVRVIQKAAWSDDCQRQFFIGKNNNTSSLHRGKKDLVVAEEITVSCVRLSHFVSSMKDAKLLLNINCEGAELEIMEDLMDTGTCGDAKMLVGLHEDSMPEPERYGSILSRMEEMNVDFIGKHYRHLRDEARELNISIRELLKRSGKEHWINWFSWRN